MNTVLMYVIMCLVCRFKAPGGRFRNLKFDLLYLTIRLFALDFYPVIVDEAEGRINYHA